MTIATLFSGGECVGVGARAAGLTHLWGVEYDDQIASVARANGFRVITSDVIDIDPHTLPVPDVLHASPVCKRASVANQSAELNEDGTKETPEDLAAGQKVAQFIDVMTPKVFTLENVYAYRHFKAFKTITAALDRHGYFWDFDNLNSADYGVPQTRRRLILRAVRGALLPMLPQPERWVGWYEAIEDLIPGLPESQFAAWQLARLPEEIKTFVSPGATAWTPPTGATEPIFTIQSSTHSLQSRAFILDCQKGAQAGGVTLRQGDEPMFTVTSGKGSRQPVRAWLVDGRNSSRALTILDDRQPCCTVCSQNKGSYRAWLSQGRVARMTPRALARFQSLPDDYILPQRRGVERTIIEVLADSYPEHIRQQILEVYMTDDKLACTIIGNGWPPLMAKKIIGGLIGCANHPAPPPSNLSNYH